MRKFWSSDADGARIQPPAAGEGIAAAKERGVHFGRTCKDRGAGYGAIRAAWERGELSSRAAARALGVAHSTFQRWCRKQM